MRTDRVDKVGYTYQVLVWGQENVDGLQLLKEERQAAVLDDLYIMLDQEAGGTRPDNLQALRLVVGSTTVWSAEVPRSPAGLLTFVREWSRQPTTHEDIRLYWSVIDGTSVEQPETLSWAFRMPQELVNGRVVHAPLGIAFSNFRAWAVPLRKEEVVAHAKDCLNWGIHRPLEDSVHALSPVNGDRDLSLSYAGSYDGVRGSSSLIDEWASYTLREHDELARAATGETQGVWTSTMGNTTDLPMIPTYNPLVAEEVESAALLVDSLYPQATLIVNALDARWDEGSAREGVRVIDDGSTDTFEFERPISDWRFGLEFSPTSALDRDSLRGMTELSNIDSWVGAPETLWASEYSRLYDWQRAYSERLAGPIPYLAAMRLHRWIWANMGDLIERMIPFNVSYMGFNNVIEPLNYERAKVKYPGSERHLDVTDPRRTRFALLALDSLVKRF